MPTISMLNWSSPGRCALRTVLSGESLLVLLRPEERDQDDAEHRDRRQQERDGVCRALLEVLVLLLHDLCGGLCLTDDVAGHDLDRPELTEGSSEAQHDAVHDGPLDARQGDATERLQRVRAERAGGLLLV